MTLVEYVKRQNQQGEFPTVRELAKRYQVKESGIVFIVHDNNDLDYNTIVGYDVGKYAVEYIGDLEEGVKLKDFVAG